MGKMTWQTTRQYCLFDGFHAPKCTDSCETDTLSTCIPFLQYAALSEKV